MTTGTTVVTWDGDNVNGKCRTVDLAYVRMVGPPACRRIFAGTWWKPWTWFRRYWEVTWHFIEDGPEP